MSLENLTPASGSTKTLENALEEVKLPEKVELLHVVIKEPNHDQDTLEKLVLKEVKCLYNVVFLNLVLKTSIVKNTEGLI